MHAERTPRATRSAVGAAVALVLGAALAAAGCDGPPIGGRRIVVGALGQFTRDVEPQLEERCAQGGCHGRPERPFALYAPGVYRLDTSRTYLDEPLDASEVGANAERVAAFAVGDGPLDDCMVLRKPLAVSAGGVWHGGGDVFADASDPTYAALRAWLAACRAVAVDAGAR